MQRHFPGSLILKEEDFINLNVKYGLVVGRLSAYKGSVPDENIADSKECSSADLFIAAPIEEMNETMQFTVPERKIIPINNDPFVFQVTPIGVMIHSKWGVEAEDNIFDNIRPL